MKDRLDADKTSGLDSRCTTPPTRPSIPSGTGTTTGRHPIEGHPQTTVLSLCTKVDEVGPSSPKDSKGRPV